MAVAFLGAGSVGDLVLQTISIGHLVAPGGDGQDAYHAKVITILKASAA